MPLTPVGRLGESITKCFNEDNRDFFSKIARPDSIYYNEIPLQRRNEILLHEAIRYRKPWAVKCYLNLE